jgi:hypothetical protein
MPHHPKTLFYSQESVMASNITLHDLSIANFDQLLYIDSIKAGWRSYSRRSYSRKSYSRRSYSYRYWR